MIRESTLEVLGDFPCFPQEVIRLEQSQARAPIAEAVGAGPAHRAFIEALPAEWQADVEVEISVGCFISKRVGTRWARTITSIGEGRPRSMGRGSKR